MRILLCLDGSPPAEVAAQLVAHLTWPRESTIRLVIAFDSTSMMIGSPWMPHLGSQADTLHEELRAHAEAVLDEGTRAVAAAGCVVEREVLVGRAASAILEMASEWQPDVMVIGSRGHGQLTSMVLGSVTSEVVDHATCPVLVARLPQLGRIVLAHDGSAYAHHAESLLTAWPMFAQTAVEVVAVAPGGSAWRSSLGPAMESELEAHARLVEATLDEYRQVAAEAATRLRRAGLSAVDHLAQGDPAESIIAAAAGRQAEMIVVGSHGRTGITRLLLGSVARKVMQHAPCSVLVSRGELPLRPPDGAGRTLGAD